MKTIAIDRAKRLRDEPHKGRNRSQKKERGALTRRAQRCNLSPFTAGSVPQP
jgi:hypothetical protein